jgi:hypothetical protein
VRACGALAQDPVSVVRYIFDLHTRHGAILALMAPKCKSETPAAGRLLPKQRMQNSNFGRAKDFPCFSRNSSFIEQLPKIAKSCDSVFR